jgi:hypothetical protein
MAIGGGGGTPPPPPRFAVKLEFAPPPFKITLGPYVCMKLKINSLILKNFVPCFQNCLKAVGKTFHPECFVCAYCGKMFANSPFYLEDGLPYCEEGN